MIILCDTREQSKLQFNHDYVEGVEVVTLSTGDYGARLQDGHIIPCFFERKSIPDAIQTFSKGYKRFFKEIQRSKDANTELIIIIEGTVTDLLKGTDYSQVKGLQIFRTILSIWNRHKVVSVFCKDRQEMALFITEYYLAYARKRTKESNASKTCD